MTTSAWSTRPVQSLLAGAIDYAGLFPPAGLSMTDTVRHYGSYRRSDDAWALGRLVVAAGRLEELARVRSEAGAGEPWGLAVTLGPDWGADREAIEAFERVESCRVEAIEGRTPDPAAAERLADFRGPGRSLYAEVAPAGDLDEMLAALARSDLSAKIRMGGVTPELIPPVSAVADFLVALWRTRLSFKATAGLHHPVRSEFPLTYRPDSPRATMHGYLNLVLASLLADAGADHALIAGALSETDRTAIEVDAAGIGWRSRRFPADAIDALRSRFHGFGSCSFREPLDDLQPLVRS
ncbi:MAG: hypothetical protein AB7R55_13840 [Gemmatimonadales bacterium]